MTDRTKTLDEMLASARSEPPVVTREEIHELLSQAPTGRPTFTTATWVRHIMIGFVLAAATTIAILVGFDAASDAPAPQPERHAPTMRYDAGRSAESTVHGTADATNATEATDAPAPRERSVVASAPQARESSVAPDPGTDDERAYGEITVHLLSNVNSIDLEYAPTVSADGRTMLFVSDRSGGFGGHDIWMARKRARADTFFVSVTNLGPSVNGPLNEGAATIPGDGRTVYFTSCEREDGKGDCDVYSAELVGASFQNIRNVAAVNSPYWDSQPSISGDGRMLFFVSNRPGALGGPSDADIYYSVREATGDWSTPRNLGAPINTVRREDSPFIHASGRILYFSSAGHGGEGGLDFCSASRADDGSWLPPVTLGAPLNTARDERFISVPASGDAIYFSSDRMSSANQGKLDIYMATLAPTTVSTLVQGRVLDRRTGAPVVAELIFVDSSTGATIASRRSDVSSGEYSFVVAPDRAVTVEIFGVADGYALPRHTIRVPSTAEYREITADLLLDAATSTRSESEPWGIVIQPNPARETIAIELSGTGRDGMHAVEIVDAYGNHMYNGSLDGGGRVTIDVSSYASGIYLARVDGHAAPFVIRR
jgi:hypothetical protein